MSDIDADTLQGMNSYNNAFLSGNYTECMKLLNTEYGENKKKLKESLFNADRYNWVRDAILSIQKFFLHDVKDYMNAVVDEDLHIQRKKIYSADDKSDACTYSSRYINKMLDNEYMATLDVNNQTLDTNGGYKQTVSAATTDNVKITDENYTCYPVSIANMNPVDVKEYNKSFAYLYNAVTNTGDSIGTVTFYSWKKPVKTFTVMLKHV